MAYDGNVRPLRKGTLAEPNRKTGTYRKSSPSPTGKPIRKGSLTQSKNAPKEMLSPRTLKNLLPSKANANIPSTTSTKGKIPKTRQVRPSTVSPVNGSKIKKGGSGYGGYTSTRGGSRGSGVKGGGGGAFLPGRTGFGEQ